MLTVISFEFLHLAGKETFLFVKVEQSSISLAQGMVWRFDQLIHVQRGVAEKAAVSL
jgi:hypothetical protein